MTDRCLLAGVVRVGDGFGFGLGAGALRGWLLGHTGIVVALNQRFSQQVGV